MIVSFTSVSLNFFILSDSYVFNLPDNFWDTKREFRLKSGLTFHWIGHSGPCSVYSLKKSALGICTDGEKQFCICQKNIDIVNTKQTTAQITNIISVCWFTVLLIYLCFNNENIVTLWYINILFKMTILIMLTCTFDSCKLFYM